MQVSFFQSISSPGTKRVLKYAFLVLAYSYLVWKLVTEGNYGDFRDEWHRIPFVRMGWVVPSLVLMPLNWWLEALKWKLLTAHLETLTLKRSYKAVLAGICTGFLTPNRLGEPIGRIAYLQKSNRKTGITLSMISGITQTLVMIFLGLPASFYFFYSTHPVLQHLQLPVTIASLVLCSLGVLFYFLLPRIVRFLLHSRLAPLLSQYFQAIGAYRFFDLIQIIAVSLLRYLVFSVQFYFVLQLFGVTLSFTHALIAIPTNYLCITLYPTIAFSEAAVRSSTAICVIGAYSPHTFQIALAGVCIWLINFLLPLIVGSLYWVRSSDSE